MLGSKKVLVPNDIRSPKSKSGFRHVRVTRLGERPKPYQAEVGVGSNNRNQQPWHGPARALAEEAAQDYCDYVNGNPVGYTAALAVAGHKYSNPSVPRDEEVEAALGILRDHRAQRRGAQGYVYGITEDGAGEFIKIGYSVNPQKRVAELQTGNPRKLVLLGYKKGTESDEKSLHQKYIKDNVLQEWFKVSPALLADIKEVV